MTKRVQCPYCFENFKIEIYPEDGRQQELIYDCEICCHPIEIQVHWDEETRKFQIGLRKSTGFN